MAAVRVRGHAPSVLGPDHAVPHAPGLDGLRGLAVVAVLASVHPGPRGRALLAGAVADAVHRQ